MTTTEPIESALRKLEDLPTSVRSWHVEAGPDATDQAAVWVWVTLAKEDVDVATRGRVRDIVRETVRKATGEAPWVYVRFRGLSETDQP